MENLFEKSIFYNQISFRYSMGKSHLAGKEIHPYHEILYYLDGNVTFLSEKFKEDLSPGTLLIIPKATYHQFYIENQENYTRLVLNFPDLDIANGLLSATMSEIKILRNMNPYLRELLERMCTILCSDRPMEEQTLFLQGAIYIILSELNMENTELTLPQQRNGSPLISKCIQYIDQNFTKDLSAKMIAEEMNISVSTLFHCFKKELGITLYKYITEKRLIYAHKLIRENSQPSKIYLDCGYKDYSTFYKAYVKMFGHPPSTK